MLFTGSEPPNGGMTDTEAYDSVYKKYENAKNLLHEITDTFNTSFSNVQNVMTKYETESNSELIGELSSVLNTTKSSLQELFTSAEDPGLYEPSKLEQQISQYKIEKSKGLELVQTLQSQIDSLQEEKRNWQIREQKGEKLIEQYQARISQLETNGNNNNKNGTYIDQQTDKPLNGTTEYDTNVCKKKNYFMC